MSWLRHRKAQLRSSPHNDFAAGIGHGAGGGFTPYREEHRAQGCFSGSADRARDVGWRGYGSGLGGGNTGHFYGTGHGGGPGDGDGSGHGGGERVLAPF